MNAKEFQTFGNTNFLNNMTPYDGTAYGEDVNGKSQCDQMMSIGSFEKADGSGSDVRNQVWNLLGWDKYKHAKVDIRLFYAQYRTQDDFTSCRWDPTQENDGIPSFYKFSNNADYWPICYSSESLKYAQSGYLVSIVCVQWADLMICKTRNLSLSQQGMKNKFGNFGLFSETLLVALLCYVPFLTYGLGTRQIPFAHFAIPSFSFYVCIFFYDEMRKI